MANSLTQLVAQPSSPQMPQQQGSAPPTGGPTPTSLNALLPGATSQPQPAAGAPSGTPAPDHHQTAAALRHLAAFESEFKALLADPGIGKENIRGDVLDMMADMMGEGWVTLPAVMKQLQSFPSEPLAQKQWVEQHYQNVRMAMTAVLTHHAQAFPGVAPWPQEEAQIRASKAANDNANLEHSDMMGALVTHYQGRARR